MKRSEVGRKAHELYENRIRSKVEAGNLGRYVVIDVNSGDYEIGDDYIGPTNLLHGRHKDSALYTLRIGHPVVGRIGGKIAPART